MPFFNTKTIASLEQRPAKTAIFVHIFGPRSPSHCPAARCTHTRQTAHCARLAACGLRNRWWMKNAVFAGLCSGCAIFFDVPGRLERGLAQAHCRLPSRWPAPANAPRGLVLLFLLAAKIGQCARQRMHFLPRQKGEEARPQASAPALRFALQCCKHTCKVCPHDGSTQGSSRVPAQRPLCKLRASPAWLTCLFPLSARRGPAIDRGNPSQGGGWLVPPPLEEPRAVRLRKKGA